MSKVLSLMPPFFHYYLVGAYFVLGTGLNPSGVVFNLSFISAILYILSYCIGLLFFIQIEEIKAWKA